MSMMWPPHSVKIVSTPSFLSARATRWPPEMTLPLRSFLASVSREVSRSVIILFMFLAPNQFVFRRRNFRSNG